MPHQKLIERLLAVSRLSNGEQKALVGLPYAVRNLADGDIVVHQGDRASCCTVLMTGFLSRQRVISDRNQISAFYVPGDIPDLHGLHVPTMDHDLCSTGPSTIATVSHVVLRQVLEDFPALGYALWGETVIQAAIYRNWVENLGARAALPRVAHLLCELATRLQQVGLATGGRMNLPFTQADFADACGLSTVHVNRTIQELRRRRLIDWQSQTLELLERAELESIAEFNPDYVLGRSKLAPDQSPLRLG
ncbi:Crp/Fnr family transcriptional regulator [Bradyrhizobium sp. DASA03076]|jgi:CRP-like cAMP-binding protein|uniref:cAMP-binding protein n=1 Tax=Bradyrhizobium manausense TaxID=989370 RepID=A0A0R3D849_9BRAD|nr:Crp/Fnr family transcriptional regulator [Bradyrhizobium manausense]KRQ06201.1 cAMP-binding protein [Bradyrhizobium manausense]